MERLNPYQGQIIFDEFESLVIKMNNFGISETSLKMDKSWIDILSRILKEHLDINICLMTDTGRDIKEYSKFKYKGVYITFIAK